MHRIVKASGRSLPIPLVAEKSISSTVLAAYETYSASNGQKSYRKKFEKMFEKNEAQSSSGWNECLMYMYTLKE